MPNFSPNHFNSAPNTDNNQNETLSDNNQNEILSDKQRLARIQNEIGSKVLTLVGFESRNKDIVNSSFEKARKQKEKLPGKNNEQTMNVETSPIFLVSIIWLKNMAMH